MSTHTLNFTGREVSCRSLGILFHMVPQKGLSPERLAQDSGYSLAYLLNKHERISWDGFGTIMTNASSIWSDEELIDIGYAVTESSWGKPFTLPARMLYSARDFYEKLARPVTGVAKQMFTCVQSDLLEQGPNHLILETTMLNGYPPCRPFFLITKGSLMSVPRVLGLEEAQVTMELIEGGARYDIRIPPGGGTLAWLRRAVTWPFTARATARELEDAYTLLHARYAQLEKEVTERKRVEEEREGLIAALEARNNEMEQFTYTVSHDLKTPLFTILGFAGMLEKDIADGNATLVQENIALIHEAAEKMQRLLDELLHLSRIGRVTHPPEDIPLDVLVRDAVALLAERLDAHNVQVHTADDLPVIYGDRVRLMEVVHNLLDNAAKFMGDQPNPRIDIGVRQNGQTIVCYVQDNGIGVKMRYHKQIFELFKRLNPYHEGTGVGLALAKRIVEVHGGRLWVESEGAGQGSTFCFTIPPKGETTHHAF